MGADIPFHPSDANNVASTLHVVLTKYWTYFKLGTACKWRCAQLGRILSSCIPSYACPGLRQSASEGECAPFMHKQGVCGDYAQEKWLMIKKIVLLSCLLLAIPAIAGRFSWIVPGEFNGFRMCIVQEDDAPPTTWTARTYKYVGGSSAVSVPSSLMYQISESEWCQIPVTEIGSSTFEGDETIISVAIPASVTNIGAWAFQYCKNLMTCSFGNVTVIGPSAFNGCSGLCNIGLNGVRTISSYAFWNCVSLPVELDLSAEYVDTGAFKGCSSITNLKIGVSLERL